ncbi:hypothetical protein HGT71_05905 [Rosenbergiella epipactidis]|uniref:hypothetical protein n=1 Tax=Rosenbergiella epipactidis TaxID=1544694 RepID=UPI001BDAAC14|nr:hypothetical protein [Rosenbergiella epipactidis]MBT0717806.1 hypothetical protein [Rosenbergiella epipactidis]
MKVTTLWIVTLIMFFMISSGISGVLAYRYKAALDRAEQAEGQIALQGKVIEAQQDQQRVANELSHKTLQANQRTQANAERILIQYREVLKHEKTCDFAVPADIAHGLLEYTDSLRTRALSGTTSRLNRTSTASTTTGQLTYCQAVLWIHPLLSAIAQANEQLLAIRQFEQQVIANPPVD